MPGPQIAPIDQHKLRENVYFSLRDAFNCGEFAPGDVVNLRGLADQLGTSMTPVREAVRRLVAEGALVDTPSRTLMVPPFDLRRMGDLKAARIALETLVLDQAIDNMDAAALAELKNIVDIPANDVPSGVDLRSNYEFHFALYQQSGSAVLLPMIEALWLQNGAYLNLVIRHDTVRGLDLHMHHRALIRALQDGDRDLARTILIADIEASFQVLQPEKGQDGAVA